MAFTQKIRNALPLFHRSAANQKNAAVALSAHYFEARCLEALDHKDEACDILPAGGEAKNPNPYREDARELLPPSRSRADERRRVETIRGAFQ